MSKLDTLQSSEMRSPKVSNAMLQSSRTPSALSAISCLSFLIYPHKVSKLIELLNEHFHRFERLGEKGRGRVIVFSQFRDSVAEIVRELKKASPKFLPHPFVGQGRSLVLGVCC